MKILSIGLMAFWGTGFYAALAAWPAFEMDVLLAPFVEHSGAGLCVVMRTQEGKTYMFDTGNGDPSIKDPESCAGVANNGRDYIVPWLAAHGIKELDGLVISHTHSDHIGGFLWMAKRFPIKRLWDNGFLQPGESPDCGGEGNYRRIRKEWIEAHPGAYATVKAGDKLDWGKGIDVEVVWPPPGYIGIAPNPKRSKRDVPGHHLLNGNSIGLQVTCGQVKFFIVGDIQRDYYLASMMQMIPAEKQACDVCVMPNHGIEICEEEGRLMHPKIAISTMNRSIYGPYLVKQAARFFGKYGAKIYFTHRDGNLTVTTDGKTCQVSADGSQADR